MESNAQEYTKLVQSTIEKLRSGKISPQEARDTISAAKLEVPIENKKNFFERSVESWALKNTEQKKEESTKNDDLFREAMISLSLMLSESWSSTVDALNDLDGVEDVERLLGMLKAIQKNIPDTLAGINESADFFIELESAIASSFLLGVKNKSGNKSKTEIIRPAFALAAALGLMDNSEVKSLSKLTEDISLRAKAVGVDINARIAQKIFDDIEGVIVGESTAQDIHSAAADLVKALNSQTLRQNQDVLTGVGVAMDSGNGYGQYVFGQQYSFLQKFPAQEFYREEDRKEWRDWPARWEEKGGRFFDADTHPDYESGHMIAMKDDEIWYEISAFGEPYPPFDFGSGMGIKDVSREEAVALGLMQPEDEIKPRQIDFNDGFKFSSDNFSKAIQDQIAEDLGGGFDLVDGDFTISNMGGVGSGNFGHSGRPGQKGGSVSRPKGASSKDILGGYFHHQTKNDFPEMDDEESFETPSSHGKYDYWKTHTPPPKWQSAGGIIFNKEGKVAVVKPAKGFGGYGYTFPKGKVEEGEAHEDAAHREIAEEAGIQGEIKGDLGNHEGTSSHTHYYLMHHTGDVPHLKDKEMEEVKWVHPEDAADLLYSARDLKVLIKAMVAQGNQLKNRIEWTDVLNNGGPGSGCHGENCGRPIGEEFTHEEKKSLIEWTEDGYRKIRQYQKIENSDLTDEEKAHQLQSAFGFDVEYWGNISDGLKSAITKLPPYCCDPVYRGVFARTNSDMDALLNSPTITLRASSSATTADYVAHGFAFDHDFKAREGGPVVFKIRTKTGVAIGDYSSFRAEGEVLLKPRTHYKVVGKVQKESSELVGADGTGKYWEMELEETDSMNNRHAHIADSAGADEEGSRFWDLDVDYIGIHKDTEGLNG